MRPNNEKNFSCICRLFSFKLIAAFRRIQCVWIARYVNLLTTFHSCVYFTKVMAQSVAGKAVRCARTHAGAAAGGMPLAIPRHGQAIWTSLASRATARS